MPQDIPNGLSRSAGNGMGNWQRIKTRRFPRCQGYKTLQVARIPLRCARRGPPGGKQRVPNIDGSKTPIFDALAEDLKSVGEGNGDEIMCPMCLRKFGRAELKALTKEHVLSKSLGGTALVLTCKDCNNSAGHKVQGHLKTLLQMNEGFRGDGHFVGRFTVFGETVPVGVELRPGTGLLVTPSPDFSREP